MDESQEAHERAVGLNFIAWYNAKHRTALTFTGRAGEAPDLIFRGGDREIRAEVTTAYYNALQAEFLWKPVRHRDDAPRMWHADDFERSLIRNINEEIARKCLNDYGPGCVLLVSVHPTVTTSTMMKEILKDLVLPKRIPFDGIYLVGHFAPASRMGHAELEVRQLG